MSTKKILIIIAIAASGFIIWNSDSIQREFFPKEHWSKQVALLEDVVSMDEVMLRDARIELKKLLMTAKLQVAQEINLSKSLGLSREEARKEAIEMIKTERQFLRDDKSMWDEILKDDREKLKQARSQLSRYVQ